MGDESDFSDQKYRLFLQGKRTISANYWWSSGLQIYVRIRDKTCGIIYKNVEKLTQCDIKNHHYTETNHGSHGCNIGIAASLGSRDKFLYNNKYHSTRGEPESVG